MINRRLWLGVAVAVAGFLSGRSASADRPAPGEADPKQVIDRAVAFLRSRQAEDGSWSRQRSPGITGVVVTGLLQSGGVSPDDPMIVKAYRYIGSLVNPKAGHIAGKDPQVQLQNYVTCVNVMALAAGDQDGRYKGVIGDATKFLEQLQWDESEGKTPASDYYGGAGYDSHSRPDLSNTQFFLDALAAAGVPKDDPALKKALVFVSRCQNLKGEWNDQPWAGIIDDGSFIYSPAGGGQTKVETPPGTKGLPGYGSMTYAGVKSMVYCGVSKDDPRVQKALSWIRGHYTVDANPGMPTAASQRGLYYYYHTMAKCLDVLGEDRVVDSAGVAHDWRSDLINALARRQTPDGSWVNENDRWMEGDPDLVTGYALMALSHCRPKK